MPPASRVTAAITPAVICLARARMGAIVFNLSGADFVVVGFNSPPTSCDVPETSLRRACDSPEPW